MAVMGHGLEQVLGERGKEEAEVEKKTLSSQFFHSSVVGHLGYFQILTIMVVLNDQQNWVLKGRNGTYMIPFRKQYY